MLTVCAAGFFCLLDRLKFDVYRNGKVCLSILGTWDGPAWSSAESLSSVLLSIQSLMCPKPYHNEPGYESRGDTATIAEYNDYIQYETLRVAVIAMLEHPTGTDSFPDVLERQFVLWYDMYVHIAKDLEARRGGSTYKDVFSSARGKFHVGELLVSLEKLKTSIMEKLSHLDAPPPSALRPGELDKSGIPYAVDRLQDEFRMLTTQTPAGASASPRDMTHPFLWDATIMGPERTPWEGGLYSLEIRFSSQHPNRPPYVRFVTEMFHPNVTTDGVPALDLIQTRWNPNTRLGTILAELQKMLGSPSPLYPVHLDAAHMYRTDRRQYDRRARRIAQEG